MDRITGSSETLMRQAPMTAAEYLREAIKEIDAAFGQGYAQKNPQLVGAFIQTAAQDFGASVIARALQDISESLSFIASKEA